MSRYIMNVLYYMHSSVTSIYRYTDIYTYIMSIQCTGILTLSCDSSIHIFFIKQAFNIPEIAGISMSSPGDASHFELETHYNNPRMVPGVSLLCLYCVSIVSLLCLYCVSIVSLLCLYCVSIVSLLCLYCVSIVSLLLCTNNIVSDSKEDF